MYITDWVALQFLFCCWKQLLWNYWFLKKLNQLYNHTSNIKNTWLNLLFEKRWISSFFAKVIYLYILNSTYVFTQFVQKSEIYMLQPCKLVLCLYEKPHMFRIFKAFLWNDSLRSRTYYFLVSNNQITVLFLSVFWF